MSDPTTREALEVALANAVRESASILNEHQVNGVVLTVRMALDQMGYRPAHEVAEDITTRFHLGPYVTASIRAAFPAPTEEPTKTLAGFDATPAAQPYSLTEEPKP